MRVAITFGNATKRTPYETALHEFGIEFVVNPVSLESLDGLLLPGGSDINPAQYRQTNAGSEKADDGRDALERRLLGEAFAADLPVFAICRGLQMFNIVCCGTLIQDLPSKSVHRVRPDAKPGAHPAAHGIEVYANTRMAGIIGVGRHEVNSRHHQAAAEPVGSGLVVSARSEDGVVEAIEMPGAAFAVAVQWHPEDRILVSEADRKLFEAFAAAISDR